MNRKKTHIVTASGANVVRIEIHLNNERIAWAEGTPEEAEATAATILDSAKLAREKMEALVRTPAQPG